MPRDDFAPNQAVAVSGEVPGDDELHALIAGAVLHRTDLVAMPGFKLDLSANPGFRKVFFKAGCECGTSALLSVEVGGDKTLGEIEAVLPTLAQRIETQADSFSRMSCDAHRQFRMGRAAPR